MLLNIGGEVVALIKPQFEAGREKVGKKGVVREPETHFEVIEKVALFADSIGFKILDIEYSPIKGPEGNIEYLIHLKKESDEEEYKADNNLDEFLDKSREVVKSAHDTLDK
jgi:23S rRNA (cytidine1920-2'-O)/16S rRNA (cytidine1409-2'-O)-methyltransferase